MFGLSSAKATGFPLVAQMPDDMACIGTVAGQQNVCIVRCQNPIGPFGGCVPVQTAANNTAGAGVKRSAMKFLA
jgi:Egh16-like virulence factor